MTRRNSDSSVSLWRVLVVATCIVVAVIGVVFVADGTPPERFTGALTVLCGVGLAWIVGRGE